MTTNTNNVSRTRLRVVRSDGREFPSFFVAYRELLGTAQELGYSEHQRMRAAVRGGSEVRDRHGFTWKSVGGTVAEATIRWTDFTFGVELELLAPFGMNEVRGMLADCGASGWNVVHDGSLSSAPGYTAMEVVTSVLQGQEGLEQLAHVMDKLKERGCRVNSSCGMHVHVGVRGMKASRLRKIAIAFINAEQHFDALVPPTRRANRYCQSNAARHINASALEQATTVQQLGTQLNGGNSPQHYNPFRYYKLNFQSFVRHGTVEFRQHGGTVESEKATAWVKLITGFCAAAARSEQQAVRAEVSFEQFLAAASPDETTTRFMNERRVKFAARRAVAA